ncbi:large ribosomal subunit protein bL9m [Procambarus clarkii]|uniref:large ribosomal subunit protein bL9m n=1 Tax=Procambarus clarkii TaxID=6728 RepID=UPI001E671331|nr:39S ribosomal protein L9, mitochondrial-like [Procambarus clarkii]
MLHSVVQSLAGFHLSQPGLGVAARALITKDIKAKACTGPLLQQVRTTFILKRRTKVELAKAHKGLTSRRLKARHFVYDLVEATNSRKQDPVKVILMDSVDGLGSKGQVLEVRPNKARNQLLLPGIAVYASPENVEKYSTLMIEASKEEDQPSSQYARQTAEQLSLQVISVSMNLKNPWQLERWHVRVAFRKAGIYLPDDALTLPSEPIIGPDLSLQGKEFVVRVKINNKEETPVRCRINHYATNPRDRLPWIYHHWELPAEPIFPEEAPILQELTKKYPKLRTLEEEEL